MKNIIRKVFLEDWLIKLVALAITLGLWLGVTGLSTPATKRLTVQLVPNVANNIEITNNAINEVDIVISGDERKVKPLTGKDLVATLDLTSVQPGDRVISLTPQNVSVELPQGIKLDEIQPSRIAVRLEIVEELELPVRAAVHGKPADGYEVYGDPIVTPQRVRVRGPASFMSTLQVVLTDPISVEGQKEDVVVKQAPLSVSNPRATIFNTVVDVTVRIGEKRVEQTYLLQASAQTAEKKVSVTLFGPRSLLSKIRPTDLGIEMIKSDSGPDTPQLTMPSELQDGVEVRRIKILN